MYTFFLQIPFFLFLFIVYCVFLFVFFVHFFFFRTVNNAAPTFPGNFKSALEQFDVNEDGLIDYAEFLEIDRRFPMVLFPAFRLQDYMQKNTLGELFVVEFLH